VVPLHEAMLPILQRYYENTTAILSLIGREWMLSQANASSKYQVSVVFIEIV
jgi:hypothetical protein